MHQIEESYSPLVFSQAILEEDAPLSVCRPIDKRLPKCLLVDKPQPRVPSWPHVVHFMETFLLQDAKPGTKVYRRSVSTGPN